jgi:hypothetical protein
MNNIGTHPDILEVERNGLPEKEPEKIQCPTCEKMVLADDLKYCDQAGCYNKRHCFQEYRDPVEPSTTYWVCEECAAELDDIYDAKNKRHDYNVLVATVKAAIETIPACEGRGSLVGILRHQGRLSEVSHD